MHWFLHTFFKMLSFQDNIRYRLQPTSIRPNFQRYLMLGFICSIVNSHPMMPFFLSLFWILNKNLGMISYLKACSVGPSVGCLLASRWACSFHHLDWRLEGRYGFPVRVRVHTFKLLSQNKSNSPINIFSFQMENSLGAHITFMKSKHWNAKEDRRWAIECTNAGFVTGHCKW